MTHPIGVHRLVFIKFQEFGMVRKTARHCVLPVSTVHRWLHDTSWYSKKATKRPRRKQTNISHRIATCLLDFYSDPMNSFKTQNHAREHVKQCLGLSVSSSSIQRAIKEVGLTRKRLSTKVLGRKDPLKVQEFLIKFARLKESLGNPLVVSVDECGFSEKCAPLYGYSLKGSRCAIRMKRGNWKHYSLIHAIASDGTSFHQIKEGSVKKRDFINYVLSMPFPPNTIILVDNCSIHKGLEDVFNKKGYYVCFLPPYCPQLQPVELSFSKIKGCFRSFWPWSNDQNDEANIVAFIEKAIETETPGDIHGFFRHVSQEMIASA